MRYIISLFDTLALRRFWCPSVRLGCGMSRRSSGVQLCTSCRRPVAPHAACVPVPCAFCRASRTCTMRARGRAVPGGSRRPPVGRGFRHAPGSANQRRPPAAAAGPRCGPSSTADQCGGASPGQGTTLCTGSERPCVSRGTAPSSGCVDFAAGTLRVA